MQSVIANNAKITVDTKCYATYALADLAFLIDYYNARSGARIPRMDCASMIGFASAQPILRQDSTSGTFLVQQVNSITTASFSTT